MADPQIVVQPIGAEDVDKVSHFFHGHLNSRVNVSAWQALLSPPWVDDAAPNRGFALIAEGKVVGAYAAVYARRSVQDRELTFCNMAAFCVLEEFRGHGLRLARALLKQRGLVFTDLSASGNVVALNERLGFRRITGPSKIRVNLPHVRRRNIRVSTTVDDVAGLFDEIDARVFRDHRRAPAARHLVVSSGERYAYLVYRRHRIKRLPIFALPLYVGGDRDLLASAWAQVAAVLLRQGMPITVAEPRILGFTPGGIGRDMRHPRPRMILSRDADVDLCDYAYSELALVRW